MPVSFMAWAKANRNELAVEPHIDVERSYGVDDEDWQDPEVVASRYGPIGSQPDGTFDPEAADVILASMGYQRISPWMNGQAPNIHGPRGQWAAEVSERR